MSKELESKFIYESDQNALCFKVTTFYNTLSSVYQSAKNKQKKISWKGGMKRIECPIINLWGELSGKVTTTFGDTFIIPSLLLHPLQLSKLQIRYKTIVLLRFWRWK